MAIENAFPQTPLLPGEGEAGYERVRPLLGLERELFSAWFRWLTSSMSDGAQRLNMERCRLEAANDAARAKKPNSMATLQQGSRRRVVCVCVVDSLFKRVDGELGVSGGPFFLGERQRRPASNVETPAAAASAHCCGCWRPQ